MSTVQPTETYHHSETDIVLIQVRPGRYSVAILNEDKTEAWFPWDFDEQFKEDASRMGRDLCKGYYGMLEEFREKHTGYTMPYPIQRD